VVTNANHLVTNLNALLADARPILTNLQIITTTLTNSNGSLGQWLLPPGIPAQVGLTLTNVNTLLHTADTNLNGLSDSIGLTLVQLADITSNLNRQVQANTNMLSDISGLVTNADYLMQGLRRHWLLRSAFKTNAPPPVRPTTPVKPILRSSRQF
jgi:ABC-type transporter Mla subunit MlaD